MAKGQTIRLVSPETRQRAHKLIDCAPEGAVVNIQEAGRTLDQNAKLWVLLSQLSRAKPGGRRHSPDVWKHLAMQACGYAVQFETGLNGQPFPTGFRSSKLTKSQMSELIEFITAWGADNGVSWDYEELRDS